MPVSDTRSGNQAAPEAARLSLWTVIGAVAASVLTAGVLGSASGIMQIPSVVTELTALRTAHEASNTAMVSVSERVRSAELSGEATDRRLTEQSRRIDALELRLQQREADNRAESIDIERNLTAMEGRSKDRNTEAEGMISALRNSVADLADRQKVVQESVAVLRQNLYDLATHGYSRGSLPRSPSQPTPWTSPFALPPENNNGDRTYLPASPRICIEDASLAYLPDVTW
jgi:chromosome segregation ATPase